MFEGASVRENRCTLFFCPMVSRYILLVLILQRTNKANRGQKNTQQRDVFTLATITKIWKTKKTQ